MIAAGVTDLAVAGDRLRKLAEQGRAAAARAVAKLAAGLKDHREQVVFANRATPVDRASSGRAPRIQAENSGNLVRVTDAGGCAIDDRRFGITHIRGALEQSKERFHPPKPREAMAKSRHPHSPSLAEPGYLRFPLDHRPPDGEAVVIRELREAMRR